MKNTKSCCSGFPLLLILLVSRNIWSWQISRDRSGGALQKLIQLLSPPQLPHEAPRVLCSQTLQCLLLSICFRDIFSSHCVPLWRWEPRSSPSLWQSTFGQFPEDLCLFLASVSAPCLTWYHPSSQETSPRCFLGLPIVLKSHAVEGVWH